MKDKIFPRNLTARAERRVAGNPESTRLESGVGNCYPGLEFDHRNLDRRFFPGLVVEFVSQDDALAPEVQRRGARVVEVVTNDPGLSLGPAATDEQRQVAGQLRQVLNGDSGTALAAGGWFLATITQGQRRVELAVTPPGGGPLVPLDGLVVWRLVRCLEPGPVQLELVNRTAGAGSLSITLTGWRRQFVDPRSGVIDPSFGPGEMSQSLCSPWQHDFRDCSCYYWASNHPDIVLGEVRPGEPTLPSGGSADARRALARIDWLRSDRARARTSDALPSGRQNRPEEMDHYEINRRWQDLAIVLGDSETASVYRPRSADTANPFANPDELAQHISQLATLEHVLALEYLYALYSVRTAEEVDGGQWPTLKDDVTFVRHFLLLVAVSEMMHLRWANQLLWELAEHDLIRRADFGPQLGVATEVPASAAGRPRPRALRPLSRATLADFVAVEQPSGFIEGQYARVTATLRQKEYPEALYQLASRIVNEGMEHFSRFRDIDLILAEYPRRDPPYLRPVQPGNATNPDVKKALDLYEGILDNLEAAYATGSVQDRARIIQARQNMTDLALVAEKLGAAGLGVPFF